MARIDEPTPNRSIKARSRQEWFLDPDFEVSGSSWKNSVMLTLSPSSTEPGKGFSWIPLHRIVSRVASVRLPVAGSFCTKQRGSLPPFRRVGMSITI